MFFHFPLQCSRMSILPYKVNFVQRRFTKRTAFEERNPSSVLNIFQDGSKLQNYAQVRTSEFMTQI